MAIVNARHKILCGVTLLLFVILPAFSQKQVLRAAPSREAAETLSNSLRQAIESLVATFGEDYPKGREYLTQLEGIESTLVNADEDDAQQQLQCKLEALRREALTANPLVSRQPLVYIVRHQYTYDHHNTHNFSPDTKHEFNMGRFRPGSALKVINFGKKREIVTLLETSDGVIRDPSVHWDGKRILFSMRKNHKDSYHIYEINTDGTGLNQLTHLVDVEDIHPLYLPDDTIIFSSTREPKYCMCNKHLQANIYRMESDGANIHQITKNTLFDRPTDIMPDGRILYDRWEYVDRNFGDAQSLWTVRPDGTNQALYWGNNTPAPGAVIDARMIPGTQQAICIFSSCHDIAWGAMAIIDRRLGMDGRKPVQRIWPENSIDRVRDPGTANNAWDAFVKLSPKYQNPYPLDEKFFLVSRLFVGSGLPNDPNNQTGIYLVDVFGNEILLHSEVLSCFNPLPLAPRVRPKNMVSVRNFKNEEGLLYVQDVYEGTHMSGVKRGSAKYLRVVETPEKRYWAPGRWQAQGAEHPGVNWHSFETKRILGTVPIEKDGSAHFFVPSERFIYFQLLDENGMMIQSMRSGMVVQSGEKTGCVGCHEDRRMAPPFNKGQMPIAIQKPPKILEGWQGTTRDFCYMTEVQPVFDKSCVRCHDYGKPAGKKLNLAADRNLIFNTSYNELWRKKYIKVIGGGPAEIKQPYSWGSHASPLVQVLLNKHDSHEDVELSPESFDRIVTWIDINAVFYPDYSTSYPNHPGGHSPINELQINRLSQLTGQNLSKQIDRTANQGPLVSFDRPEMSEVLNVFKNTNTPEYAEALQIIRSGRENFLKNPDVGMEGFKLSSIDLWREEKYQRRLKIELWYREAIQNNDKRYDWQVEEQLAK